MTDPYATTLGEVDALLDTLLGVPTFGLDPAAVTAALELAHRVAARVASVELRLARHAALVEVDAKTLWVRGTNQTPRQAAVRLRLAAALETRPRLHTAMAAGAVTEAQAVVIDHALQDLPGDLDSGLVEQAEAHLVGLAEVHHPDELRRLGRHLVEVVAPERAEAHLAAAVDAEYRRASEACRLSLVDRRDGTWEGRFVVPDLHGHTLKKLLLAFAAPKHQAAVVDGLREPTPSPQRLGRAFSELVERYPTDQIPAAGGISARVMITLDHAQLLDQLSGCGGSGVALLDHTTPLPAWVARRMACEAGILPAVLGGKGEILDLGRTRRFHTETQRVVVHRRDVTCRAEGCDWPAAMSHVHHLQPWSRGGPTDVDTALTLCPHHHARAHDPTYEMDAGRHGRVVFTRVGITPRPGPAPAGRPTGAARPGSPPPRRPAAPAPNPGVRRPTAAPTRC